MSFTDTFNAAIAEAWNQVAAEARAQVDGDVPDADAERAIRLRRSALENKLAAVSATLSIASSPNPTVALADMVTMVTLQRMVLESPPALELFGEAIVDELLETYRAQEEKIWKIAALAMTEVQREQLAQLIAEWRAEHPDATYVSNVRFEDFANARQQPLLPADDARENVLSLLAIDPLAGLDPAQREVQKSRMLGERIFFYASRSPLVLKWQVESLYQSMLGAPELQELLGSLDEATGSMARISAVAEELPQQFAAERTAALDQFFDRVAAERRGLIDHAIGALDEQREATLTDLDRAQDEFHGTLSHYREAVEVTDETATSLTQAIEAADAFAARFDRSPDAPPEPEDPEEPQRNVFADYDAAVARTGDAAEQLTALARSLDDLLGSAAGDGDSVPLRAAVSDVQAGVRDVVDHAFLRLLALAAVTPLSIALAAILYRRATRR